MQFVRFELNLQMEIIIITCIVRLEDISGVIGRIVWLILARARSIFLLRLLSSSCPALANITSAKVAKLSNMLWLLSSNSERVMWLRDLIVWSDFLKITLLDIIASNDITNCGYEIGDITNDGNVNIIDAIALLQRILNPI